MAEYLLASASGAMVTAKNRSHIPGYSLVRMQSLLEKLDVDAPVRRHHAVLPVVHQIAQVVEDRLLAGLQTIYDF